LGADHPDTTASLYNLAVLYCSMGRYPEAEVLLVRAITITENKLGSNHPNTITFKQSLAALQSMSKTTLWSKITKWFKGD
jgi:Tetratricopeptide repeat